MLPQPPRKGPTAPPPPAKGYDVCIVQKGQDPDDGPSIQIDNQTNATVSLVYDGVPKDVYVRARSQYGRTSEWVGPLTLGPNEESGFDLRPISPNGVEVVSSQMSLIVKWNHPGRPTFRIYYAKIGDPFTQYVETTEKSYTFSSLDFPEFKATQIKFLVRAVSANGVEDGNHNAIIGVMRTDDQYVPSNQFMEASVVTP